MNQGRTRRGKTAQKAKNAANGGGNINSGSSGNNSSSDNNGNKGQPNREKIQVFCRLKPTKRGNNLLSNGSRNASSESSDDNQCCMRPVGDTVVQVTPPERVTQPFRELRYTFDRVFDEHCSQKMVFDLVALPLVKSVLQGMNSLLFTYGVTGSGKTFTMTGTPPDHTGIMPRALDVIFNSIHQSMAPPNLFKPDKLNGFELQNELDALAERQQQFLTNINKAKQQNGRQRILQKDCDPHFASRHIEPTKVEVNKNSLYAVFVTYIEIYNNSVYDLLEDGIDDCLRSRHLQTKIVREDSTRNMYVHGVTELEVKSPEEAFEVFCKGQKRKRMAQTSLNHESSRSHSVFTIRLVQALMGETACGGGSGDSGKRTVGISQLSLVDLAGSERTNRTKNTGLRLREAGNINNSLMTLRTCLELLRENQTTSSQKVIPYRESRLTHLFKNYFEGEGQVSMIVCVNPHEDDYEENLHVLKFAEMSQEVQVTCPTPYRVTLYTPSARKAAKNALRQETDESENDLFAVPTKIPKKTISRKLLTDMPSLKLLHINEKETFFSNLINYFEVNATQCKDFTDNIIKRKDALTEMLYSSVRDAGVALTENQALKSVLDKEKSKVSDLEAKLGHSDMQVAMYKRKLDDCERHVKKLRSDLSGKECLLNKKKAEGEKVKEIMSNKIAQEKEKMKSEIERKFRSQKSAMELEMRNKEIKLAEVRRILSADYLASTPRQGIERSNAEAVTPAPTPAPRNNYVTPSPFVIQSARKMGMAVSNRRHRRSRSAGGAVGGGDVWLEHRPAMAVPLNTVMQPSMTRRKSVTKLTDVKDITEKASKYCLVTQQQDSDGDLETRLYKGDVIPTAGGGAQVMFNDVEVLKQVSPNVSPPMLRSRRLLRSNTTLQNDIVSNCAVALEGHSANKCKP